MKTLFLIAMLSSPVFAGQKYGFKDDALLDDEMANNYKEHQFPRIVNGTAQTMTITNLRGVSDTSSASAGSVGEYIASSVVSASAVSSPGTGQIFDVTNIALTPGDWDVSGIVEYSANGATVIGTTSGIGTASGNNAAGLVAGDTRVDGLGPNASTDMAYAIPAVRISISGSATYYLKAATGHSVATPKAYGRISARRVR